MEYGLAGIETGVEDQTVVTMEFVVGNPLRDLDHMRQLIGIIGSQFGDVRIMLTRHDEYMYLGFRIDVPERIGGVVLIHLFAWDLTGNDFAEQAIRIAHDAPSFRLRTFASMLLRNRDKPHTAASREATQRAGK